MSNTYEILFLFDPTAGANWEAVEAEINRLMERAEAEVILTKRLEERRLAYEIKGCKRGVYAITYLKADGEKMSALERDARLSEMILRILILRADGLSLEKMKAATLGGGHDRPREIDGRRDDRDRRDYRDHRDDRDHGAPPRAPAPEQDADASLVGTSEAPEAQD